MSIINVKNLSHGFGDRIIFENVSFRLLKGEHVGLVGANGEGKSTFMNIVTGALQPDEGKVEWSKKVRVGYLDQNSALEKGQTIRDVLSSAFQYLYDIEAEIGDLYMEMAEVDANMDKLMEEVGELQDIIDHSDFYQINAKVEDVGRGLGLHEIGFERDVDDLSGGQRTKVLLAKLLLQKPEILMLDEPTNYLDEEHIAWLKQYLLDYENAFILISHDMTFLNSVINIVYHMENGDLTRYVGDYEAFQGVYDMRKKQLESAYKKQQQEIANLKDFVARNKANVATRNMAMSRQKKLDKMDVIELSAERPKPKFDFKKGATSGKLIVATEDLVIGYDEPLSSPLNLRAERGQKIAIVGANGIGKTTLLRSILGEIKPVSGRVERGEKLEIGYFEQEVKNDNGKTALQELWDTFPAMNQAEVRAALARVGLTTKHIESKVQVLSGGEKAKVRLAKLMNAESNILVLDEPTNHLDIDAKDELKRALKEYKGTVLLISHEPEFYQEIATEIWNVEKWTTKLF